jgi:Ca-activated chloride channel family protein
MTFSRFLLIPAALAGAMILWAAAMPMNGLPIQEPTTGEQQLPPRISGQTYRVSVDLVNILCSVLDRNTNAFLTNLSREDFTIYEDGVKQEIINFARETNLPLTFALLVDTSQSVAPKLKFEQEAAINFIQSTMRANDRAMLLEFSSGVTLLQDFTDDPNKIIKEIRKLKAAGGTALYDAIYMTCDEKLIRETGRKAIIILSDGEDESSRMSRRQAIEVALRAEATVFAISVTKGGFFGVGASGGEGDAILTDITRETGGRIFFPFKIDDLEDSFRQISQELRSQYSIGYLSTNTARDGTYRKIEIKAAEKGLRLNYRKGYYAPSR